MDETREDLLRAWMAMGAYIRGNRLLQDLSMNEMLVCNVLADQAPDQPPVTATELCQRTQLLKSQINRILTSMEDRDLIQRTRSPEDRRVVYIRLREEALPRYQREHAHVLTVLEAVRSALGEEDTRQLTALIQRATAAVTQYEQQRRS